MDNLQLDLEIENSFIYANGFMKESEGIFPLSFADIFYNSQDLCAKVGLFLGEFKDNYCRPLGKLEFPNGIGRTYRNVINSLIEKHNLSLNYLEKGSV